MGSYKSIKSVIVSQSQSLDKSTRSSKVECTNLLSNVDSYLIHVERIDPNKLFIERRGWIEDMSVANRQLHVVVKLRRLHHQGRRWRFSRFRIARL